ncbi:arylsulfotransferase family protein [Haladaptatus caseinilyticus]|uniref:arylsulfotransferase family protein n=1 Tax=Haladaptatus caseinilyticus TaxID=2993314 RepID=UPI00224AB45E|nr:arylsulfotransferase family protein [Haladaptatus caseinilyticus]
MQTPSRRQILAVGAILLCCLPLLASPLTAQSGGHGSSQNPCAGTMVTPANGTTVIAVQGYSWLENGGKEPAKLVGVGPKGEVKWVHHTAEHGMIWGYDVDPMENGNLFVTGTARGKTVVYEFNPRTQEHVWEESLPIHDTHDIDLINNGTQLLVANMRASNPETGKANDSIFVYDLEKDEIVWRWFFRSEYPKSVGGNYSKDWTHVNDVDKIGDGLYLASPRNFDQAIVVNRSTNDVEMKLGSYGDKDILDKQHNPDYLESKDGNPTFLVADSENERIVEYEKQGDDWELTWELGKQGDFRWPRDADRLSNGNTLIGDSKNQRVLEVTPKGEVVWEFYAPWLVYDVARLPDERAKSPTMADRNVTGSYGISGDTAKYDAETMKQCHSYLQSIDGWADGQQPETGTGSNDSGVQDDDERNDGSLGGQNGGGSVSDPGASLPGFDFVVGAVGLLLAVAVLVRRS